MNIIITVTEYNNKTHNNTYFSGLIYVNRDNRLDVYTIPYEYGSRSDYLTSAGRILDREGVVSLKYYDNGDVESLVRYCHDNGIVIYETKIKVSSKKDMI
jgi:hypothetical protein